MEDSRRRMKEMIVINNSLFTHDIEITQSVLFNILNLLS